MGSYSDALPRCCAINEWPKRDGGVFLAVCGQPASVLYMGLADRAFCEQHAPLAAMTVLPENKLRVLIK